MKLFVLTREAERDLVQLKYFLTESGGPLIARKVLREIRDSLELLGRQPRAGHSRADLTELPALFWPIRSYLIVYRPDSQPLQILRVVHGMRDVERILQ